MENIFISQKNIIVNKESGEVIFTCPESRIIVKLLYDDDQIFILHESKDDIVDTEISSITYTGEKVWNASDTGAFVDDYDGLSDCCLSEVFGSEHGKALTVEAWSFSYVYVFERQSGQLINKYINK